MNIEEEQYATFFERFNKLYFDKNRFIEGLKYAHILGFIKYTLLNIAKLPSTLITAFAAEGIFAAKLYLVDRYVFDNSNELEELQSKFKFANSIVFAVTMSATCHYLHKLITSMPKHQYLGYFTEHAYIAKFAVGLGLGIFASYDPQVRVTQENDQTILDFISGIAIGSSLCFILYIKEKMNLSFTAKLLFSNKYIELFGLISDIIIPSFILIYKLAQTKEIAQEKNNDFNIEEEKKFKTEFGSDFPIYL